MKLANNTSLADQNDILALTPREIVGELDRYIIGQEDAKKAVAVALRNRYRRKQVEESLRDEIMPKNILAIGPTGVGKTEIARRLAKLANAPFIKIEATKFTEVGYVGKDVDSVIRDLVDVAVNMMRSAMQKQVEEKAKELANQRIIDILVGDKAAAATKEKFKKAVESGQMDDNEIEVEIIDNPTNPGANFEIPGMQIGMINMSDMLGKALGGEKKKKVKMKIKEAIEALSKEEADNLIDEEQIVRDAIHACENDGIVFIDEIDKICVKTNSVRGSEISREGVQRDLLPLVEGTTVSTKYGMVKTDHILFIASGAFHTSKPSDLLPELQGRFPTRVQLKPLSEKDMYRILKEPEANLIIQYSALIAIEDVILKFNDNAIKEIAKIASRLNQEVENIGARRLHTLMEKILEEVSFTSPETPGKVINIDKKYVNSHIGDLEHDTDLSKFIL